MSAETIRYPAAFHLVMLLWNCRGLANAASISTARDMVDVHQPDILLLTKTRIRQDRVQCVVDRLPFDGSDAIGFRGGIILMWNRRKVDVRILGITEQEIHAVMKVHNSNTTWLFSGIYASPRFRESKILWHNLEAIAESVNTPWVVGCDRGL